MNYFGFPRLCGSCAALLLVGVSTAAAQDHAHDHDHPEHPEVERIVVTATPLAHSRDELASPIQRLGREEILDRAGSTLGETLSRIPGVTTSGFSGGASRPIIRGQNAFRTEVLEDGLTTQDVSRLSPDHAVPINPLSAQSIEVVRGPATLRYGGGAVAGVINTITGRVPQRLADSPVLGEVAAYYGDNEDDASVALLAEGSNGSFGWHADGAFQRSDDYRTGADDRQRGTHRQGGSASVGGAWFGDGLRIGAGYAHFRNDYGIPESDADVAVEMDTNRYRIEADSELPGRWFKQLRIVGVYSDYEHLERADGVVGQRFDNNEFEGRAELHHTEWSGFSGALGVTARHRDFAAGGEAAEFLAPTETRQFAAYLFEERSLSSVLDGLNTQFGLRVEHTRVEGTPSGAAQRAREFVPVSGSLAFVWNALEAWTVGTTAAISQRPPADVELFARGAHEATGTFELGNVNLSEETAFTGELRIAADYDRLRFEVASFLSHYDGYIFGALTGVAVGPDALDELLYQASDARFYGGEFVLEADLAELAGGSLQFDGQLDWVRARFVSDRHVGDRDVPRIPPLRWGAGLSYRSERLRGRIGFLRSERQQYTGTNELGVGAYTLVDLRIGYRFDVGSRDGVELYFDAQNLADAAARNPVAFNKDEVRLRGRLLRVGLTGSF